MSQVVIGKPKAQILYSELHFEKPRIQLKSQAREAVCYVCNSELKEGACLTARRVGSKMVLMCDAHCA